MQDSPPHLTFIVFAYKGKYPEGSLRNTFFLWIWTGGPAESQISLCFFFVFLLGQERGLGKSPKKVVRQNWYIQITLFLLARLSFVKMWKCFECATCEGKVGGGRKKNSSSL